MKTKENKAAMTGRDLVEFGNQLFENGLIATSPQNAREVVELFETGLPRPLGPEALLEAATVCDVAADAFRSMARERADAAA